MSDSTAARWKHVPVKKPTRTFEKIRRSHGGRVSRVGDLVRASIVCDTIADVTKTLYIIMDDDAVQILRGKQRFSVDFDAATSAGYRDFQLSLVCGGVVVDTPSGGPSSQECRKHIVEMQIHLRDVHDQKTKAETEVAVDGAGLLESPTRELQPLTGHQRYTAFRTIMAK